MNYKDNFISVIMPAYNCEKYLEDSVNSVLNQTYKFWELIIIDDASTDRTNEIIKKIINKTHKYDIRVYLNETNIGVSETRKKAIDLAKGKWIAFLDSDDMWEEQKLEKQMELIKKSKREFVFTGVSYINEYGKPYKGIYKVPEEVNYLKLRKGNVIACSSVIIKKDLLNNVKFVDDSMHEDFALWLQILKKNIIAYSINEPLLIYRISNNSKSGNKIKSIKMTYKVFRFMNINIFLSIYLVLKHSYSAMKKYKRIKRG